MAGLRVLVVGLGTMGMAHARAYARIEGCEVVGLCTRHIGQLTLPPALAAASKFSDFGAALAALKPDIVSINTLPDTHAAYAIEAMEAGAHVFVEKPLATSVADAEAVVATARRTGRKLVIGYILRHHPSWVRFIEIARTLGTPLVFRLNLNQQSSGATWQAHKRLLASVTPLVDCGVHYVDVMCQMTDAAPLRVHAIGARLSDEIGTANYGQLQVEFADGSVGWFESGWGPMVSEEAVFIRDVFGPRGSASIVAAEAGGAAKSDDINAHTGASQILRHYPDEGRPDERLGVAAEPDFDRLCELEQRFLLDAIRTDLDLSRHLQDAVTSLKIVLAADESIRTHQVVTL